MIQPNLTLDRLRANDLPLDWMTVYVGWKNAADVDVAFSVSDDDVRNLAVDALANCKPSDEDPLFRIADDTSVSRTDIANYLRQFTEGSGVSETLALRKWRYVFASELTERPLTKRHDWDGADDYFQVEEWDYSWSLDYALSKWDSAPLPLPPKVGANTQSAFERNFIRLQEWLAQEKAEAMYISTATTESPLISVPPLQ